MPKYGPFSHQKWVTPSRDNPVALGGQHIVRRYTRPKFKSQAELEDALHRIDAYSRHKTPRKPIYNPYMIWNKRELLEADLTDLQTLQEHNQGVRYWLVVIDCFTRFVWLRAIKNKNGATVADAMQSILSDMDGPQIKRLNSDRGAEFKSRNWLQLMQRFGIKHNYPNTHCRMVERVQQTLQKMVHTHMTDRESRTYIHALQDIVDAYNSKFHRMIHTSPRRAELPRNHYAVRLALERHIQKIREKRIKPKYKIGQIVRVAKYDMLFRRSFDEQFDVEMFLVAEVSERLPRPMYRLKKPTGELTDDVYYEEELSPIYGDDFKVQEVIKKRRYRGRPQSLVHWLGWPRELSTWVDDSDINASY